MLKLYTIHGPEKKNVTQCIFVCAPSLIYFLKEMNVFNKF